MKTWAIEVYYGNVNPTYVVKHKLEQWRKVLYENGFKFEPSGPYKDKTVEWRVTHYDNDQALAEILFAKGDQLLPAKIREIENV